MKPLSHLHVSPGAGVRLDVRTVCLVVLLAGVAPCAGLKDWLARVERRYNSARTMEAQFRQTFTAQGRRQVESGSLVLRKPGRMRWDYARPEGKLFLADGKWVWFYSPASGRAERSRLKASDDERAPLAFLLGRLDFDKLFRDFELIDSASGPVIRALPKSGRVPYTSVEFDLGPNGEIRRLKVTGGDGSLSEYEFEGERLNAAVSEDRFRFTPPAGVKVVDVEPGDAER